MNTLLDLLNVYEGLGDREAFLWTNRFITRRYTYRQAHDAIAGFASWLDSAGIRKGDRIVIWGENRPEWVFAFWGALLRGVQVVPVDYRFSSDLCRRICRESGPSLLVHGDSVAANDIPLRRLPFAAMGDFPVPSNLVPIPVGPDDIVEIVFTSGTTGTPKGVVHRHRNIVANLKPFKEEIEKYRKWAAPFQPIRLLNLLPLSHMFGQALGLFIPLLLGGSIAFMEEMHPAAIIDTTKRHRISVLVCVPRIAQNLANEIQRQFTLPPEPAAKGLTGVALRWWRYRRIHARFGWKFWSLVVGGAHVEPALEAFWRRLGFLVVQGYGLTETSPVVAVNHPFHARTGSVGKAIKGQEVRIADDGEILVRGDSVVGEVDPEGWLHTGDVGEIDPEGRLYFKGRKKDMIVTPEGMNVHPEDVESVFSRVQGVRETVVVSLHDEIHASLILADAARDPAGLVAEANKALEPHQRVRSWSVWPDEDFPRTASTMKIKRGEVAERIARGLAPAPSQRSALPEDLSSLTSLERVDLLSDLEQRYGVELDEQSFARLQTSKQLTDWIEGSLAETQPSVAEPSLWAASRAVRLVRAVLQRALVLPLFRHYLPFSVTGLEHIAALKPPVLFAANHTSHLDAPAIVLALPAGWRWRLSPAVRQEQFRAFFDPQSSSWSDVLRAALQYGLAGIFFNTYPLPQEMGGVRRALKATGELIGRGYCPLVFPEGARTPDGEMHAFRPGIGLMAVRLRMPVVPVYIDGLFRVHSVHDSWPTPGPVAVAFGRALEFGPETDYTDAARQIEAAVRGLKG